MKRKLIDLLRETTQPDDDRHWAVDCFAAAMMATVIWFTVKWLRTPLAEGSFGNNHQRYSVPSVQHRNAYRSSTRDGRRGSTSFQSHAVTRSPIRG